MSLIEMSQPQNPAVVTKASPIDSRETYLLVTAGGGTRWVDDPETATAFASMREATRMAMRLPSNLRAFSLPRTAGSASRQIH